MDEETERERGEKIIDVLIPPCEWDEEDQRWIQRVSKADSKQAIFPRPLVEVSFIHPAACSGEIRGRPRNMSGSSLSSAVRKGCMDGGNADACPGCKTAHQTIKHIVDNFALHTTTLAKNTTSIP